MSKFTKNFLLCGDVDYYCLLCKEVFRSTESAEKHIKWEKHRIAIKNQTCVSKFKNDLIYNIDNNYFCEYCNYITNSTNDISLHIKEEQHISYKSKAGPKFCKESIGQYRSGSIVIKNLIISNKQWNGIRNKHCNICGFELDNIARHIELEDHIIKLIKTEVICNDDNVYRKIDNELFQCFTCKKTYLLSSLAEHLSSMEHSTIIDEMKVKLKSPSRSDIEKRLIECQKENFIINHETNIAKCKTCEVEVNVIFTIMLEHVKKHHTVASMDSKDNSKHSLIIQIDHGKRRSELSKFGKLHSIRLNSGGSKGYCSICDIYLSPHKHVFENHLEGVNHKGILELKTSVPPQKSEKKPFKNILVMKFLVDVIYIPELYEYWINGEFCINKYSFVFYNHIDTETQFAKTKCYVCDLWIPHEDEVHHLSSLLHISNFQAARIIDIKDEFIREVKPNLYHCGYCNQLYAFWKTVEHHITTWKHKANKKPRIMVNRLANFFSEHNPRVINLGLSNVELFNCLIASTFNIKWSLPSVTTMTR